MENRGDSYTNRDWCFRYRNQRIIKGTGVFGSWKTSGYHLNYSIIENRQNTEMTPEDLRRLAVTQTPIKNHQLKLMWKTQGVNNNTTPNNNNNGMVLIFELKSVLRWVGKKTIISLFFLHDTPYGRYRTYIHVQSLKTEKRLFYLLFESEIIRMCR